MASKVGTSYDNDGLDFARSKANANLFVMSLSAKFEYTDSNIAILSFPPTQELTCMSCTRGMDSMSRPCMPWGSLRELSLLLSPARSSIGLAERDPLCSTVHWRCGLIY